MRMVLGFFAGIDWPAREPVPSIRSNFAGKDQGLADRRSILPAKASGPHSARWWERICWIDSDGA